MAVDLIKQFEAIPAAYPDPPSGLSSDAGALDADAIWARIEAYTAHRFTAREVVWTLLGGGGDQWHPTLTPVLSRVAHEWSDDAWAPVTLLDGPLGICLPYDGTYRITAQVGGGDVPAPVSEAFRRLAEYLTDDTGSGVRQTSVNVGPITSSETRHVEWLPRALQLSGAADLLRNYRRA